MKKILVIGAGRSSGALIEYLLKESSNIPAKITVADGNLNLALTKINNHPNGNAIKIEVTADGIENHIVAAHDIVISMMPPHLHPPIARQCLALGKHFVTASYVSNEIQELHEEFIKKGLVCMNEIGLDPGIDHMSAMELIDDIKSKGGKITSFKSYCGGLVAPESDDNPWHYKVTWNPRNVVLAGQGIAQYKLGHQIKRLPYRRIFQEIESFHFDAIGDYEGYMNRDSLSYIRQYGLDDVATMCRGTIRGKDYCQAWSVLIDLGWTDHLTQIKDQNLTYKAVTKSLLDGNCENLSEYCQVNKIDPKICEMLVFLGLEDDKPIGLKSYILADALEQLIVTKWAMQPLDKDMVLMRHLFEFELDGKQSKLQSDLVVIGDGEGGHSAMSKTVGLPLGIFVQRLALGLVEETGVMIPISANIYKPILEQLQELDISFHHTMS